MCGIVGLVEVRDGDVRTLFRVGHRYCPPDAGIASGDESLLALQESSALVRPHFIVRLLAHVSGAAWVLDVFGWMFAHVSASLVTGDVPGSGAAKHRLEQDNRVASGLNRKCDARRMGGSSCRRHTSQLRRRGEIGEKLWMERRL